MDVHIVPILEDNFAYIVVDRATKAAVVVDPAEPQKVVEAVRKANVDLKAVLTTHHHWDHAGGNEEFVKSMPVPVYGGEERIKALTNLVDDGHSFKVGQLDVRVYKNPCHTKGSVSYAITTPDSSDRSIFTGDTLFVAGCGRFFEGTAAEMTHNMLNIFAKLPPDTKVYPGHEYTVANLKFALSVEPDNDAIKRKLDWSVLRRQEGLPTVPSTISEELETNPFMRLASPAIQTATNSNEAVSIMHKLREMKNRL